MSQPTFPRLTPGADVTQPAFNALSAAAEERSRSAHHEGGTGGFGSASAAPATPWVLVKVTESLDAPDSSSLYAHAFVEVTRTEDGVENVSGGLAGFTDNTPLYELNGRRLPDGTVVRAWADVGGQCLVCDAGPIDRMLVQLVKKEYGEDGCVKYRAIVVSRVGISCGGDFVRTLCGYVYHTQNIDLPPRHSPSPLYARPSLTTTSATAGVAEWANYGTGPNLLDGRAATSKMQQTQETQYLLPHKFCFVLPETVDGDAVAISDVKVEIAVTTSGDKVADAEVKLTRWDGFNLVVLGTSKHTGANFAAGDSTRTYSGTPSSWGVSDLSPADVNRDEFGVALRFRNNSGEPRTVGVDEVKVTLTFDPSGGYAHHSMVFVRRAQGAEAVWLTDAMPWVDLFRYDGTSDADGLIAHLRRRTQAGAWEEGEEVRLIIAE